MENFNYVVFRNLVKIVTMQNYRREAYTKAAYVANNLSLREYFYKLIEESDKFTEELSNCITEIETDLKIERSEEEVSGTIEKSQFYYAIAKTNSNLRTVCLSCKLGDVSCTKLYEEILGFVNICQFPSIRAMVQNQKKKIESHLDSSFDLSFI